MAGGKIVRIAGGKIIEHYETLTYYQDNFTINAGGGIELTTNGEMIYGEPEQPQTGGKYIIRGWWSSDREGKNKIRKACLGDTVYFQIETQNIHEGEKVNFRLFDDDSEFHLFWGTFLFPHTEKKREEIPLFYREDSQISVSRPYTATTVDKEGRAVIYFTLVEDSVLKKMIDEDKGYEIELFFEITYKEQTAELPILFQDYLKVGYNPNHNIVIKPASQDYNFPEMFTHEGNPIVIFLEENPAKASTKEQESKLGEKAMTVGQEILKETDVEKLYKKTYQIAVREVEKGKLVTNTMDIKSSKRMYKSQVVQYALDGTEFKVKRAVNFGFKNAYVQEGKLVTTKGLNQIEYFVNAGLKNQLLRFSAKFLECGVLDLGALIQGAAEGKMSIFPPMDLIIDQTIADIEEDMQEQFIVDLENTKRKGVEVLQKFINSDQRATEYNYNLSMNVSDEVLQEILSKEIKSYNKIFDRQLKYNDSLKRNYLLIKFATHPIENKGIYVIEAIFINNNFVNE